ncbi:MAG: hypothetical protein ACRC0R_01565 [Cetobacterium sp.]
MKKLILILCENRAKILEKKLEEISSLFVRGEEFVQLNDFDDVLNLKEYLLRNQNGNENLDIQIIYSKNVSRNLLGFIFLVFFTEEKNIPRSFNNNVKFEMINKDILSETCEFFKEYFNMKLEKDEILKVNDETSILETKILELNQELKNLKQKNKELRIQIEKHKFEYEKEIIRNKLKK